ASLISIPSIPITPNVAPTAEAGTTLVSLEKIRVNRRQPREKFNEEALQNLAASIREQGIIQPLIVTKTVDGRYELIAGERRFRASKIAGLTEVPVVIREADENKMLELALIENIQREDLNAIEEAKGYQALQDQFQLTHADIAQRVGKSREAVANALRLLKLPQIIQEDVIAGKMSSSHARVLVSLPNIQDQLYFRERILQETLSVRDIEEMTQNKVLGRRKQAKTEKKDLSPQMKLLIDEMENALGTRVRLQGKNKEGQGEVVIPYFSWQELDRIYRKIVH
ncbi:MAG: ParB/RepB/Spo0J family partition protein, partial [Deltaproteobacteria bacterium]|nr:ParB/RepB/Spo0J family partition protein [Deltaproteobacteria bacterium]